MATVATEFEDIYNCSDDEDSSAKMPQRRPSLRRSASVKQPSRLVIPPARAQTTETWSAVDELKKITSPVALTPSAQLCMSPAQMNFMDMQQAFEVPTLSAPPSLDGSLTSEQLALMSAPPTPDIGNDEVTTEEAWAGVQLQPGALATLHRLSHDEEDLHERPSQVLEVPHEPVHPAPEMRQQPLSLITNFQPQETQSHILCPSPRRQSLAGLTTLDIPSPGGFFAGLSTRARHTWHMPSTAEDMVPPTSTTAEQFYKCPWNNNASIPPVPKRKDTAEDFYNIDAFISQSNAPIVEHVIEFNDDDDLSDDMPTARPIPPKETARQASPPTSPVHEDAPTEIVVDYDPNYAREQQEAALSGLDRTELWLMAQRSYLRVVDQSSDGEESPLKAIAEVAEDQEEANEPQPEPEQATTSRKTVRFSNMVSKTGHPKKLPSLLVRQESAYYRAFQDYIIRTQRHDAFVQQLPRFEALQAQRVSLSDAHRNQLLGKYQLSVIPQSAKKRMSANVARGDDCLVDDPEKLRLEKEAEAMNQVAMSTWHVAAMKMLNGGRLISAPVTKRLARFSLMSPGKDGVARDRARILDLGGQATCDWAWHCALQFPNTKIYTVTTKAIRQLSNSNIRGPPNHRQVAVDRLTHLPFEDNQFDLVSARELHSILKFVGENGEDEWDSCLAECMRVLKPGGYLEFSLLDSDIINAGPAGLAKSVEFGFALKTLGYDPNPTKSWLGRLARVGFQDVRRAWMCMPMGAKRNIYKPPTPPLDANGAEAKTCQLDAMVMGSGSDIANVCSIFGGWKWERWLLRCEMEKVAGELRLADIVTKGAAIEEASKCLDNVPAVFEEGRNMKSGFRMLNGYARKPKPDTEVIKIAFCD